MKRIWGFLLFFIFAFAGLARAEDTPPVVIELFTSQSCAPCRPADKLIRRIAEKKNLITLTLPVSYWDILGWKDTLASPDTTSRQKAYARYRMSGSVYTPQILVNGSIDVIGNRDRDVRQAVRRFLQNSPSENNVQVSLLQDDRQGYQIRLSEFGQPRPHHATVWLMSLQRRASVRVKTGENKGHLLKYSNVVRNIMNVGLWQGQPRILHIPESKLPHYPDGALAVLVQENGYGPILAADYYIPHAH